MLQRLIAAAVACAGLAVAVGIAQPAAAATPRILITRVSVNPSGADTRVNSQINREYIVFKNTTSATISLSGWTVRDKANHVYNFAFSLGAGKSVTLHTGKGTNTSAHKYWGQGWYIWNNTGDAAYLRDTAGKTVDSCSWGSVAATSC
jgi:hypothetical protein